MEKFSVYDLLGLFLPGFVFVYLINALAITYQLPFHLNSGDNTWKIEISIYFALSLVFGAVLYAANFWLVHQNWFNKPTKMYRKVAELYQEIDNKPMKMNKVLNKKAKTWFGEGIFFRKQNGTRKRSLKKNTLSNFTKSFTTAPTTNWNTLTKLMLRRLSKASIISSGSLQPHYLLSLP